MRKLLIAFVALGGLAGAKPVTDSHKVFSVQAPDGWTAPAEAAQSAWKNENNTGAMTITSVPMKEKTLEQWAKGVSRQNPKTSVADEKLDGQPAKRLEFTNAEGYTNVIWLARRGKHGALVSLVYSGECQDDVTAIRKSIVSSFHWTK